MVAGRISWGYRMIQLTACHQTQKERKGGRKQNHHPASNQTSISIGSGKLFDQNNTNQCEDVSYNNDDKSGSADFRGGVSRGNHSSDLETSIRHAK